MMKEKMNIYYDEDGDFLEITTEEISNCYFNNIGDGIFEIVDKINGKVKGIAIFSFRKRTKNLENLKISLPFKIELVSS